MNWRIKGLTQKVLSAVPGGIVLNTRMQAALGGLRNFDKAMAAKVDEWILSMKYLEAAGISVRGARILEIGTGWYPVLPICFVLAGAETVVTVDIVPHLTEAGMYRLLRTLKDHIPSIAKTTGLTPEIIRNRLELIVNQPNLAEILRSSNIEYRAPEDAGDIELEPGSIDIIYSNSVLEHVHRKALGDIMRESLRILKPGGIVMHNVACNDHYAHFDKSISYVNYLRYSEAKWRLWNNSLQFQNRLRASEFLQSAQDAGLEIIARRTHVSPGTHEAIRTMTVAPEFRGFSEADLVTTTIDFLARKGTGNEASL